MKRGEVVIKRSKRGVAWTVIGLLLGLPLIWSFPAWGKTLVIAADEWCPYNCKPEDENPGYVVEIAREIFEPAGHVVDYRLLPWKRALAEGEAGRVTAVIALMPEESESFIIPEEEISSQANEFFTRKDDPWRFTSLASLEGRRIGIILGYSYGEETDAYLAAHPEKVDAVAGVNALDMNLQKLVHGRIDVFVDTAPVVWYRAAQLGIKDHIQLAGNDGRYDDLYIAFSKALPESRQYAVLFDEGLRNLRLSGRLAAILGKYGLSDWKPYRADAMTK